MKHRLAGLDRDRAGHEQPVTEPEPTPDVLVVGAPRSGTSLVGQLLAGAGFGFGRRLLPPSEANPRGFYEDVEVTELSDELLAPHLPGGADPHGDRADGADAEERRRLAWLAVLPAEVAVTATDGQRARMAALLPPAPACLKDPRFPYVLDAWRPVLRPGTRFVGVVRTPGEVAASLRAMWRRDRPYYGDLEVTEAHGHALWEAMNRRLLALAADGPWLLVDHADLVAGTALPALGRFVGRDLSAEAVDPRLHRSVAAPGAPPSARALYDRLRAVTVGARA